MSHHRKIAIIGSGIAGITAAYWLAKTDAKITVYDRERYPAMKTSYANGAQLSVCNSPVWTTWPMIYKGIDWMFKKDAPFYISPSISYNKISWLIKFLNTTRKGVEVANTEKTIQMALKSRNAIDEISQSELLTFNRISKGILHVYTSLESFEVAKNMKDIMTSNGCDWQILDSNECRQLDPTLKNNELIVGGIHTLDDSTGDCHQFCNNLAKILIKKYKVEFKLNYNVNYITPGNSDIMVDDDIYDDVVIAAGVDSQFWGKKLGDKLDIYPVKGYSITIDLPSVDYGYAPLISLLDDDAKIVCSRLNTQQLRVAGTAELSGYNLDIKPHRIKPLLDWTNKWFPNIDTRQFKPWAGLRPMTPNMLPHIKRGSHNRVWYHCGHGHLGWTLSAGTAKELVNLMTS